MRRVHLEAALELEDLALVQQTAPNYVRGLQLAASTYTNLANAGIKLGTDPEPLYREASKRLTRVIELRPGNPDPSATRGKLLYNHFGYVANRKRPAHDLCRSAIRDFTEAIRLKSPEAAKLAGYRDEAERYLRENPEQR